MRIPEPFWAVVLALFGTVVTLVVLFSPAEANIKVAVLAVASNLVSGALGAFAGHSSNNNPTSPGAPKLPE